jgi:hypothetical protein
MDWIPTPYDGANQLKFGMSATEIAQILGAPKTTQKRPNGVLNEFRGVNDPMVRYTKDEMNQLVFGPRTDRVFLDGIHYHAETPTVFIAHVKHRDNDLWWSPGGSIISLTLGVSFDENNPGEADKTIALFARGVFDEVIAMSKKL